MRRYNIDLAVVAAVAALRRDGTFPTAAQVAERLCVTPRAVNYAMVRLAQLGVVRRYVDDGAHGRGWRYLYDVSGRAAYQVYVGDAPTREKVRQFFEECVLAETAYRGNALRIQWRRYANEGADRA